MKKIIFVIGGARSGKSAYSLDRADRMAGKKVFIATAEPFDHEMQERIKDHRHERGADWQTIEEPLDVAGVLERTRDSKGAVILDCLTLWLSNVMHHRTDPEVAFEKLIEELQHSRSADLFIVSNEVGMGIVPKNDLARQFRDLAGLLNQRVAAAADEVVLVAAGIPVKIKG